ncbi:hypothetical protein K432DRAFT_173277 [Lepidopterella palustris CBS 459.81]|uniref:Uncharacterized protein n=1 Tax=Lepidopterella palustris CBS 459.81 TaxID=1314670 RepID=A0A8E2E152_9PEZI|nr:hypothetical protein K432DRAFT_173277 [Lepidopterella palustris CBS 459.81]
MLETEWQVILYKQTFPLTLYEIEIYLRLMEDWSSLTTASCPFLAAHESGVRPPLSFESTSTCPVSSSSLTTASCPFLAARKSGVRPQLSFESMSTWPVSSSSLTTASCPFTAAHESGVSP